MSSISRNDNKGQLSIPVLEPPEMVSELHQKQSFYNLCQKFDMDTDSMEVIYTESQWEDNNNKSKDSIIGKLALKNSLSDYSKNCEIPNKAEKRMKKVQEQCKSKTIVDESWINIEEEDKTHVPRKTTCRQEKHALIK